MKYLADTNVVSEMTTPTPHEGVRAWLNANADDTRIAWTTVVELRSGVAQMSSGSRRDRVAALVDEIVGGYFAAEDMPLGDGTAKAFAALVAERKSAGLMKDWQDTSIAAVARERGLTVVTRNVSDFPGVPVLDPWNEKAPGVRSKGAV